MRDSNCDKPLMSDAYARFLWATAPRYYALQRIVQRARRWRYPRRSRWWRVISLAFSIGMGISLVCLVIAWTGELTEGPTWRASIAIWAFMPLLFIAIVAQRLWNDRTMRRAVHRLPRWYALRRADMGLTREEARIIDEARQARDPLSAWREIRERVPKREKGYDRMLGPQLRWMCSAAWGWVWYAAALAILLVFSLLTILGPRDTDPSDRDWLVWSMAYGEFALVIAAAIAQNRARVQLNRMAGAVGMTLTDRCAKCDYALKGLPPMHNGEQDVMEVTCPECGFTHRV